MKHVAGIIAGFWLLSLAGMANAQEVTLRHALNGRNLDTLASLVLRFNALQKGKGKVVLQDMKSVEDRRHLPQMALLDTDDNMTFFGTLPRFRPLYQVMKENGQKLDASAQPRPMPQE